MSRLVFTLISLTSLLSASSASAHVLRLAPLHADAEATTAATSSPSPSPSASAASSTWLGTSQVVTEEAVDHLVKVLQEDTQGAALVAQATQHAQNTVHSPFWTVISICDDVDPNLMGLTNWGSPVVIPDARDPEEIAVNLLTNGSTNTVAANQYYQNRINQDRTQNKVPLTAPFNVLYFPDVFLVKAMDQAPGICLQRSLSVNEAVDTLYHEMVHYIASDWSSWPKMQTFSNEQDYEQKTVLSGGDEVDAYLSQWSYEIRREGIQSLPPAIQKYFTSDGTFIPKDSSGNDNRLAIAQPILQGQIFAGGQGYHQLRFIQEYGDNLNYENQAIQNLEQYLPTVTQNRQANLGYYQDLLRNAQSQSGDNSTQARQANLNLQEDQNSLPRITQEEQSFSQLLGELTTLIKQYNATFSAPEPQASPSSASK